jgi:uncharacterized heparinase superfamily protein
MLRRAQSTWDRTGWFYRPEHLAPARFRSGAAKVLAQMAELRLTLWPSRSDPDWLASIGNGRFCFLNATRDLAINGRNGQHAIDWNPPMPHLWRFHLQCHEYLLELATHCSLAEAWRLVELWLLDPAHQTPRSSENAWHPFCISRRLPVWLMLAAVSTPPESIASQFWSSINAQARWLRRHMEWDLGGNHLLENLRALTIANFLVDGVDVASDEWLLKQVQQQLAMQVLPSGQHFERTPMYHALMQLAVLEIAAVFAFAQQSEAEDVFKVAQQMATWQSGVIHPDGQIPLFGDSSLDESPLPTPLCSAAGERCDTTGEGATTIGDAWCWRSHEADFLIVDGGPVACDHLPAHGHADLFTVEASIAGRRVFVDGGVFDYEDSEMRRYCRGTAAHNTLQVDDENHCDVWSRFRMGRRGHPIFARTGCQPPFCWFSAAHDAYAFLKVPWTGRFVAAAPGPIWVIIDWISGSGQHEMVSRLRVHPDVVLQRTGNSELQLVTRPCDGAQEQSASSAGWRRFRLTLAGDAHLESEKGWYCPNFGDRQAIDVIAGRSQCRDQQWLGWILQPIDEEGAVRAFFREGNFEVCLPTGDVVAIPIG